MYSSRALAIHEDNIKTSHYIDLFGLCLIHKLITLVYFMNYYSAFREGCDQNGHMNITK